MKRATHRPASAFNAGLMLSSVLMGGIIALPVSAQDFDAVLAAPDDINLNLAYARSAAAAGDLNGAAGALERILIADPNRHSARLLYAAVLYRLDDLQGAREQLELLEPVNLTPLQRAEAEQYRRDVERRRAPTKFGGSLSVGVAHEEDGAGALSTQFDSPFAPPVSESSTSSLVSLRLNMSHEMGGGLSTYGSLGLHDKSTFDGADADLRRGTAELGLARQGRLSRWSVGAVVRAYELVGDPYLVEAGLRGASSWRLTTATTFSLTGEAVNQAFDEPGVDALAAFTGGDRDGWRYSVTAGLNHRLNARSSIGASVGWTAKEASYEPFGYSGPQMQANYEARTAFGTYFAASGGVQYLDYDAQDPFFIGFGAPVREDVRSWARLAIGSPISASFGGSTGDWRENTTIETAVTYASRDSEAPLADYDGFGAELRLTWRFDARD